MSFEPICVGLVFYSLQYYVQDRKETFLHYGYWLNFAGDLESINMKDLGELTSFPELSN